MVIRRKTKRLLVAAALAIGGFIVLGMWRPTTQGKGAQEILRGEAEPQRRAAPDAAQVFQVTPAAQVCSCSLLTSHALFSFQ